MSALLSIPITSYYSIERLALIYFPYTQQDHKLNETGIIQGTGLRNGNKKATSNHLLVAFILFLYTG